MASLAPAEKAPTGKPLKVGSPHDPAEREADRIADILTAPEEPAMPVCAACAAGGAPCAACGGGGHGAGVLRRQVAGGGGSPMRMQEPSSVQRVLSEPGEPMPSGIRGKFERRLGARPAIQIGPGVGTISSVRAGAQPSPLSRQLDHLRREEDHRGTMEVLPGTGQPASRNTKTASESAAQTGMNRDVSVSPSFSQLDFDRVRLHTNAQATEAARHIRASAFTLDQTIVLQSDQYDPNRPSGERLLAHEVAHVLQNQQSPAEATVLKRETATEVKDRYTSLGGSILDEEKLARHLVTCIRSGQYAFVAEVINVVPWSDRDDVGVEIMNVLRGRDLIQIGRNEAGVNLLRTLRNEIGDWWGWTTREEGNLADLLGAVLNDPGERVGWNFGRIEQIKSEGGTDLEALARLFEDDLIIDDGSVASRLQSILSATQSLLIPGLQTGIEFSDTGFAGDQNPGGAGFRDPHPSSRNQVGHFLTAVGLNYSPDVVSRPIPLFGTIRGMVQAPESMSDADVAMRLTIGHEKAPDPNGQMAAIDVVLSGVFEHVLPGPEGESDEEREQRIGRAVVEETRQQIDRIIAAFRTQFQAATDADVQAWNEALHALGSGEQLDMSAAKAPLRRVAINPSGRGNSIQDLRLSLVGWRLGQLISSGSFNDGAAVARWIRSNLGSPASALAPSP